MSNLNDCMFAALEAQGYTEGTLNDRLYAWLFDQCGGASQSPPLASGDASILWGSASNFTAWAVETAFAANCNLYFYEGSNGQPGPEFPSSCGYYYFDGVDTNDFEVQSVIIDADTPFSTGEFIVKFEVFSVVSGSAPIQLNYTAGREGEWWELFRCDIRLDDDVADGTVQEQYVDITVARNSGAGDPDAGTAVPVPGSEGTVRVRMIADRRTP